MLQTIRHDGRKALLTVPDGTQADVPYGDYLYNVCRFADQVECYRDRYSTTGKEEKEEKEEMKDMNELEKLLTSLVGELKPVPIEPVDRVSTDPIYFDYTEKDNTRWLNLMADALKNAETFEIHCWNEETEEIALALKYGKRKESDWTYGKIITGEVTPEFIEMLLSQPKPTDIEAANKMTPFFNVFLDDTFQSCHWGTEIYFGG